MTLTSPSGMVGLICLWVWWFACCAKRETRREIEGRDSVKFLEAIAPQGSSPTGGAEAEGPYAVGKAGRLSDEAYRTGRPQRSRPDDAMRGRRARTRDGKTAETGWEGFWRPMPCFYFGLTRSFVPG
ncbi:hypothetical protein B0T14DRAFT_509250 [Immersiella caudata]|uniref:Secreted protein n=1 Tax=Immersiella caudata TaxID=314043 RepID=A0AA39X3H9_9PEZI|nr:hypothetical protein B0T14DRAFT_509250 [Immersiella caudata]